MKKMALHPDELRIGNFKQAGSPGNTMMWMIAIVVLIILVIVILVTRKNKQDEQ